VIAADVEASPPVGYEQEEAVARMFQAAAQQVAGSRQEGLFDHWLPHTLTDVEASFSRCAATPCDEG
jgi:hypothetical protein